MTSTSTRAAAPGLFSWWRAGSADAQRALVAAGLGWMLDAFDVMLYALLLPAIIADLGLSRQTAGAIGSVTLVAAAAGGLAFGVIADRYGRTKALMASVIIYSVFTAACGFANTAAQLAIFRVLLGIGMGGEWASGAALVSETWPAEHRGKALGLMQSAWAIGYGLAAARDDAGAAGLGLACRLLHRRTAGTADGMGAALRQGAAALDGTARVRRRRSAACPRSSPTAAPD